MICSGAWAPKADRTGVSMSPGQSHCFMPKILQEVCKHPDRQPRVIRDMSTFPSAGHLVSWAGRCLGNDQSAGKRRSGRPRKAQQRLGSRSEKPPLAAIRTKNTYLAAQYQRLKPRIGHGRALGAVKHSILIAFWACSQPARPTATSAATTSPATSPNARPNGLIAKLQALGHHRHLQPAAA